MKDVILYHGSRGGIEGPIQPKSRERCDFGPGFYMGDSPEQAQSLIVNEPVPVFYTLNFKLSEIPAERIYRPSDEEWLHIILAFRKQVPEFSTLPMAEEIREKVKNYDLIIGPISDDRMKDAMKAFANGALTDNGLYACLQYVNYGNQYVALTDFACSKIEIISERVMDDTEILSIQRYGENKRQEGRSIVNQMIKLYRNNGKYLDEIIENDLSKQNQKGPCR